MASRCYLPCGELRFRQSKGQKRVLVPCPEALRALLDELRERSKSTHILTSPRGMPWDAGNFRRRFEHYQALAGVNDVTFHDIRGTAITVLSDVGCTEAEIAAITGHTRKHLAAILEKYTARSAVQARSAVAGGASEGQFREPSCKPPRNRSG
jgi:integrase